VGKMGKLDVSNESDISVDEFNVPTSVGTRKTDKEYNITISGILYNLDTSNYYHEVLKQNGMGRTVHIVRIQDRSGHELTNARIWGTWDEADEAAKEWINALLVVNPSRFMRYVIQTIWN
jgi:hypothetical protein